MSKDHTPDGKWAFDGDVAACFDDMLKRSIPQYHVVRRAVCSLASVYRTPNTGILDLGCSRGEALAPLVEMFGKTNHYVGVEVSEPMIAAAHVRFRREIDEGYVAIQNFDLRSGYPGFTSSVTLSILTLQFIPMEHRQRVLSDAYHWLCPGGALIMVEKVLGATADVDGAMTGCYYALKRENGYSAEQIERKRLSLEGVLVPVTARWNEELLRMAGFSDVDCFWRWMNFGGWIAIKGRG